MTAVHVPDDLWNDGSTPVISTWLYEEGDQVVEGAVIAEVMVEKAAYELVAPVSGILRVLTAVEVALEKTQPVARIE